MNSMARMLTTVIIWGLVASVIITGMIQSYDAGGLAVLTLILGAGAAIVTEKIWAVSSESPAIAAEKAKRRSKVDRMLERLDDRELAELRARLMSEQDGEAISLEDLLDEQARRTGER